MGALFSKLRIGEKILFSTCLVGLLLLGVIWQYHGTVERVLADYRQLMEVHGAKESTARKIAGELWQARLAEREFLLTHDPDLVPKVAEQVRELQQQTSRLALVVPDEAESAGYIETLILAHHQRFEEIVEAWKTRGLDENSGLQGAFRDSVHRLLGLAKAHNADALYLQLLQIRRGEKDLGLRREEQYRDKVLALVKEFGQLIDDSTLAPEVKAGLFKEQAVYRKTFSDYARRVLAGEAIDGGKGAFRQAAHRIEDLLRTHYVPNLERNLLQLRRREKDYLLRQDKRYVTLAVEELGRIANQVQQSAISSQQKDQLQGLLDAYQKDFLALVEQDDLIDILLAEMDASAQQVIPLVQSTVDHADTALKHNSAEIRAASEARSRLMLWIVAVASVLGLFLALAIAHHISRRVVRMAGMLDTMAREQPTERLAEIPGARNEVDAMAGSVNAMADHKDHLIAWWKTSMEEADAARALHATISDPDDKTGSACARAEQELRASIEQRDAHLATFHREMHNHADRIVAANEQLAKHSRGQGARQQQSTIDQAARSILSSLDVVLTHHEKPK